MRPLSFSNKKKILQKDSNASKFAFFFVNLNIRAFPFRVVIAIRMSSRGHHSDFFFFFKAVAHMAISPCKT
jgi:hypothetical protein